MAHFLAYYFCPFDTARVEILFYSIGRSTVFEESSTGLIQKVLVSLFAGDPFFASMVWPRCLDLDLKPDVALASGFLMDFFVKLSMSMIMLFRQFWRASLLSLYYCKGLPKYACA